MYITDPDTGEQVRIDNIRRVELKFDIIEHEDPYYILINHEGERIAKVLREHLDVKTRSKLDSLAEYNIGKY